MKPILLFMLALVASGVAAQTCPGNMKRTAPDDRYELHNGGAEVRDKRTGLIWQRCSLGQSWDGSSCTGVAVRHTWEQALEAAQATRGEWLLPNIRQLNSLMEPGCYNPAINITLFPNAPISYWSSSVDTESKGVWTARFAYDGKDFIGYVRLVRARP